MKHLIRKQSVKISLPENIIWRREEKEKEKLGENIEKKKKRRGGGGETSHGVTVGGGGGRKMKKKKQGSVKMK